MKALQWKSTTLWPLHWHKAISWRLFVKNYAANSSVIASFWFWWHLNTEGGKAATWWSVSFCKRWIPTLAARLDGLDTWLKELNYASLKETNLLEVSKWWKLWKTALKANFSEFNALIKGAWELQIPPILDQILQILESRRKLQPQFTPVPTFPRKP